MGIFNTAPVLEESEPPYPKIQGYKQIIFTAVLMLGFTLIFMDKMVIGTALVPISRQFHFTSLETGLLVSVYFIGSSLMQLPIGYIVDRIGYKPVLIFSLACCSLFTLLFGLIGILPLFLLTRFFTGVGEAGYPASSAKSVALNYPQKKRPFAQSILLSTSGIGGILAAVAGVPLIGNLGWQSVYYLLSGLFALSLLGIILFLPNRKSWGSSRGVKASQHVRYSELLRNKTVWILFFALIAYNTVFFGLNTWMPTFLVDVFHKKVSQLTPVIGGAAILGICAALLAGRLYGHFAGREKPMLVVASTALAVLLTAASVIHLYIIVCILLIFSVFFCETIFTGIFTWPHKIIRKEMIGSSIGFIYAGAGIGGAVGPALFGLIIGASHGLWIVTFLVMAVFALLAGYLPLAVRNIRVIN
jgi:Arabinose efflux permease